MSKEVDQRVVEMRFDNQQFEQNVKTTMSTLDRLKAALNFKGSVQGLDAVNNAAKNNSVGLIGQAAEAVSVKFSAMEVVAMTALSNITNSAVNAGKNIVNALTLEPVMTGFQEYETQINAVQTILANTSMNGTTLEQVTAALDELNLYADKTIYNFTEMARNIGTFTAAGVELDPAVEAIKGIANLAALSGSNAQQASTAMYQLSQALAAGRVSLMDWNSVVNAGMGGKVFQNALMDTAEAMGIVVDRSISFRESISSTGGKQSWLTSEVLLNTLRQFTGDLTDAELAQMGFNKAQIESIQTLAQTANDAATRVKTATQLFDTLKESVQSGWTQTWELIFGDFEEAREFFTGVSDLLSGFFQQSSDARNAFVEAVMASPWDNFSKKLQEAGVDIEDFQKKAWDAAKASGKVTDELMENAGSFEATLQNGWLTSDIIVQVLREYAGATAEVTASTDEMNKKLEEFQKVVNDVWQGDYKNGQQRVEALTKAGYDYAEVQELVNKTIDGHKLTLEDLNVTQAKALGFTEDEIKMLNDLADSAEEAGTPLNKLIEDLNKPSGRELFLNSFVNLLEAAMKLIGTFKAAWGEIFQIDPTTVYNMIEGFHNFTESLIMSDTTANKLKSTLEGFFAVIDLIRRVITTTLSRAFNTLRNVLSKVNIPILDVTANIGDSIVAFRNWVIETDAINNALDLMGEAFNAAVEQIRAWIEEFKEIPLVKRFITQAQDTVESFKSFFEKNFGDMMDRITQFIERVKQLDTINLDAIKMAFTDFKENVIDPTFDFTDVSENFNNSFGELKEGVGDNVSAIGNAFGTLTDGIMKFVSMMQGVIGDNIGLADVMAVLMGFGAVTGLQRLATAIGTITAPVGSLTGALKSLSGTLGGLTKSFKADAVVKQATAIAILAGSVAVLSMLDPAKLAGAVVAIGVLALVLTGLSYAMSKIGTVDTAKMAVAIIAFAASIGVLVAALAGLNALDAEKTQDNLLILAALVASMAAVSKLLSKNAKEFVQNSGGMIMFAGAVRLLVESLKAINELDDEHIWKSVGVLGSIMLGLAALTRVMSSPILKAKGASGGLGMISSAAGILILVASLKLLIGAIDDIANLDTSMITDNIENFIYVIGMIGGLLAVQRLGGGGLNGLGVLGMVASIKILIGVMEQLAGVDKSVIDKASKTVGQILVVFGLIVALSNLAGQHAIRAGAMILLMSGAMVILTGVITVLSHLDGSKLQNAVNAITQLMIVFGFVVALSGFAKDVQATVLQISIAIAVLATAIAALTLVDQANLRNATLALSGIMAVFALLMAITGSLKFDESVMAPLLLMTLWTGVLGGVLYALASLDTGAALGAAVGLGALMLSLTATLKILDTTGSIAAGTISSMIQLAAIAGILGVVVSALSAITDGQNALMVATMMSELIVVFAGVTAVLGKFGSGTFLTNAVNGALAIDAVIGIVGGLIVGIVALASYLVSENENLEQLATNGLSLLKTIFYGFGEVLGSIVSGFATGMTTGLPDIATNLSLFMENLGGFIEKVKTIDSATIENFVSLVGALGDVQNIKMDSKMLENFSESMPKFADAIASFGTAIGNANVNVEAVKSAAEAGKAIVDMASGIPNTGGLVSFLTGDNDLRDFSNKMFWFGFAIKSFAAQVVDLNTDAIEKAAAAGQIMVNLSKDIPNSGGKLSEWLGDNDLATWSIQLPLFGRAMSLFAESVKDIDTSGAEKAATAANMMVELSKEIPNTGGVLSVFTGDNDIFSFGIKLSGFGIALSSFCKNVKDLDTDGVEKAKYATEIMIALSKEIPNQGGGVLGWIAGDDNFTTFGDNLESFGWSLRNFYVAIKDIDSESLSTMSLVASNFVTIARDIPALGENRVSLSAFGTMIDDFGGDLKSFYGDIDEIDPSVMNGVVTELEKLVNVAGLMSGMDADTISAFGVAMSQLGSDMVSTFDQAINSSADTIAASAAILIGAFNTAIKAQTFATMNVLIEFVGTIITTLNLQVVTFYEVGGKYGQQIADGFKAKNPVIASVARTVMNNVIANLRSMYSLFYQVGDYMSQGIADGLGSSAAIQRVCARARALVRAAIEAAEAEADINSPSRVMMQDGIYMAEGFGLGMKRGVHTVESSARSMTKSALDVVSESAKKLSSLISNDIDAEPVIRPVIDLSGAEKEALKLNSLFATDQAYRINSSMNRRTSSFSTDQNGENKEPVVEQFSFTQNNYSPKALSRKEIYRQTKNQFAMAKGVVSRT